MATKKTNVVARTQTHKRRLTIGLLTHGVADDYATPMLVGASDAAREAGANLLCFPGWDLKSQRGFEAQANVIYHLAGAENLDGIVISAAIGRLIDEQAYATFCNQYSPLPIVNLGLTPPSVKDIPCVQVNSYQGLYDVISHLIEVHHCRRIAFIPALASGGHIQEMHQRVYTDVLVQHGLPVDPALICEPGHRDGVSGVRALQQLLDERHLRPGRDFDALAAINDGMALGALEELQIRGFNVPDEIAVTGYNDAQDASLSLPPLTTARQSTYDMGRFSVEVLLAQLRGEKVELLTLLPSMLMVRRSCGCLSPAVVQAAVPLAKRSGEADDQTAMPIEREILLSEVLQAVGSSRVDTLSERVSVFLDAFLSDFLTELAFEIPGSEPAQSSPRFLPLFDSILRQEATRGGKVEIWQGALSVLRRHILPWLSDPLVMAHAENLWQQARLMIGETAHGALAYQGYLSQQRIATLRQVGDALITTVGMPELLERMAEELPQLGIPSCYLALYERPFQADEGKPELPPRWSRLVLAYNEQGRVAIEKGGRRFLSRALVPDNLLGPERRSDMIVEPLYFRQEQLGFVLLEMGPQGGAVYETLQKQLSAALKGALLVEQVEQHAVKIQAAAQELKRSNAELEQFAYIASHDLQEPLRMVSSYLQLLERRYKNRLDQDADEFIAFAVDGAIRMQTLIMDLLTYSRVGTSNKPLEPTDCSVVIERVLDILKVTIEENDAAVTHEPLPTVLADDVQLTQVFQNLIGNAIKFHRPEVRPEVHIGARQRDDSWEFSIHDNGIGIDPQYFERIFMIFQRLHTHQQYPGTGIGLAVCKKIIERHGGHIWVESQPGKGTTFFFTLPPMG